MARDVNICDRPHKTLCHLRSRGLALHLIERMLQLPVAIWNELRGKELPVGFLIATPAVAHQCASKFQGFFLLFDILTMQQATCEAAVKNEMRKPFRMTRGICNSLRGALRKPKKDEPVQFSAIDDGFEIRHPFIERNLYIVALRQTDAARVIAQKRMPLRPADKHVTEDGALEIVFEMGKQVCVPSASPCQ